MKFRAGLLKIKRKINFICEMGLDLLSWPAREASLAQLGLARVDAARTVLTGRRACPPRGRRRTAPPRCVATVAPAAPDFAKLAAAAPTPPSPLHGPAPRAHFCPRPHIAAAA